MDHQRREMTDSEFLDFYREAYDAWDMPDDELIDRHRELDKAINPNWDCEKYLCWWQDPDRKPNLASKSVMAQMLNVSLKTIDDWIRKGAPVYQKGDHG